MKSLEIRKKFLQFFLKNKHEIVPSSSLIPAQDPTLLFANAGMNQFKDIFLGLEARNYKRATSIQKCVRAGGKHNDLDNVGFTKRHLTFFEMMGNFSFGDYFKKEAIRYAWDFLTKEVNLPIQNLYITIFETDDESYNIWHHEIGLPSDKIFRLGAEDNFWQMGDTGPCGPCTEIYIDKGIENGCKKISCSPGCSCDRYLEIWNLVFMQFDRQVDGVLNQLKHKGVDTGMGLERLSTILQSKDSVFETDLFAPIIEEIEKLTNLNYAKEPFERKAAFHVLADHIRSASLLIADGCAPSNEGRGYVLRKIIRRAALFTQKLTEKNIFPELSKIVVEELGSLYEELIINKNLIYKILLQEIEKFAINLLRGSEILKTYFEENQKTKIISGLQAFKLYDTFGFPYELILLIAQEHGFTVDRKDYEKHMKGQRELSGKKERDALDVLELPESLCTEFTGYQELSTQSTIAGLIINNKLATTVDKGMRCYLITYKSPFFIVGGGQVPDQGFIIINGINSPILSARHIKGRIAVEIVAPFELKIGMEVNSIVDATWRTNAMKNHTATHMLQAALIELLGKQIKQSGSLVHPDYLRFDFSYHDNLSPEDVIRIENRVNEKIRENNKVIIEYKTLKEAIAQGAIAFFGDKYNPDKVRVVDIPYFSTELCGGTHVTATGEIGLFKIIEINALSAGHKRIVALTGPKALDLFQENFTMLKKIGQEFKVPYDGAYTAVIKQKESLKETELLVKRLKKQILLSQLPLLSSQTKTINMVPYLTFTLSDSSQDELKLVVEELQKINPGVYCGTCVTDNKVIIYCQANSRLSKSIDLHKLAAYLKEKHQIHVGIKGTTLQGGGANFASDMQEPLNSWLAQNIQKYN